MSGNVEAIDKVVELHYKDIVYFSVKKVGIQEGEDVAQQALTRIIDNLGSLKDPAKLKPWMTSIVNNMCMDHLRAKKRDRNHTLTEAELEDGALLAIEEAQPEFLPEKAALDAELREVLLLIIDTLPANYADCLRLYYHDGMKYSEIAEALDIPLKKVKNDMYNGMALLKKRFEKETGTQYRYGAVAAGALPVLAQVMQAESATIVTPDMASRILENAHQHALALAAAATTATAATAGEGTATATAGEAATTTTTTAAATATKATGALAAKIAGTIAVAGIAVTAGIFALMQTDAAQPEPAPEPEPMAIAPTPTPTQETPINTLADMIGTSEATQLETMVAQGTTTPQWNDFIQHIGAQAERMAEEPDSLYTVYLLRKQDKQLMLATKESATGTLQAIYQFGPIEDLPYMSRVILMFP